VTIQIARVGRLLLRSPGRGGRSTPRRMPNFGTTVARDVNGDAAGRGRQRHASRRFDGVKLDLFIIALYLLITAGLVTIAMTVPW
jgi:hypothetical protein